MEHDGIIVGCAALYCHGDDVGELACLAVHPDHREWGYGRTAHGQRRDARARKAGIHRLFVLTTRTEHWFVERGFRIVKVDELPNQRNARYILASAALRSCVSHYNPEVICRGAFHGTYRRIASSSWPRSRGPRSSSLSHRPGKRIFEHVSKEARQQWIRMQTMINQRNRLNLVDAKHRKYPHGTGRKALFRRWCRPRTKGTSRPRP